MHSFLTIPRGRHGPDIASEADQIVVVALADIGHATRVDGHVKRRYDGSGTTSRTADARVRTHADRTKDVRFGDRCSIRDTWSGIRSDRIE